jgi:hypothetical protein
VVTRTPTQVASHAQKYKIRQNSKEKKKERKRSSIHDVTHVKNDDISAPERSIIGQASSSAASSSGQSDEQALSSPPPGIYAAPRIEQHIGGSLVSAVGTPVNLSAAGQAEQAPPAPPAGIYGAPRIEHSIGGPLVSAVGTPVNITAAGHMAYELGPDSVKVMPGDMAYELGTPMNLGPMTYPMQYTYAHS